MSELLRSDERWYMHHGDCIERMHEMPRHSVDFSIFSPPFPSLFAYTDKAEDIGNSESFAGDARLHLLWFVRALLPVIKPGRVVVVHVQNIAALKRNGESSTVDLRGMLIRLAKRAGFIYETDWGISKNPQSQAIRTRSTKLQFVSLERDRAGSAPAFSDYLIKLRAPGDNEVPIDQHGLSRNEWIEWAEGIWDWRKIRETDTLNTKNAKSESDTRHICPLQLPVIRRCVRLYSNPDEVVFSPFAGIGSEGYISLLEGRRFYGCEIKDEYHAEACRNLRKAQSQETEQLGLFAEVSA
jgi:DNA modification methylase